jgi:hypothetical protein
MLGVVSASTPAVHSNSAALTTTTALVAAEKSQTGDSAGGVGGDGGSGCMGMIPIDPISSLVCGILAFDGNSQCCQCNNATMGMGDLNRLLGVFQSNCSRMLLEELEDTRVDVRCSQYSALAFCLGCTSEAIGFHVCLRIVL